LNGQVLEFLHGSLVVFAGALESVTLFA